MSQLGTDVAMIISGTHIGLADKEQQSRTAVGKTGIDKGRDLRIVSNFRFEVIPK